MTKCKDCLWWDKSSKESTFGLCVKSGDWNEEDYGPDCVEFADKITRSEHGKSEAANTDLRPTESGGG